MRFGHSFYRRVLLVCAVVIVSVALVLALGVMQPVMAEASRGATTEKAVIAFWVIIGLNLLLSMTVFLIAMPSKEFDWISKSVLVVAGLIVLLLGIALADAGSAYLSHGPAMQFASVLLFICAAADFLAGVLVVAAAVLLPMEIVWRDKPDPTD